MRGKIPEKVARERATEYGEAQRRAFLDGFEAAISESENMAELREWLTEQRDEASEQLDREDERDALWIGRRMAMIDVLTRLSEMGCYSEDNE